MTAGDKKGCLFYCRFYFPEEKGGDSLAGNLRERNTEIQEPGNQFAKLIPRFAFTAFLAVVLLAVSAAPVFADTIFDTAKIAMQTVYKDVAGIATVAAVVCSAVCLSGAVFAVHC